MLVAIQFASRNQEVDKPLRYSNILRCVGQSLESLELKALEIKTHGELYVVQAWKKGTSTSLDLEKRYTLEDVRRLEIEGRRKRKPLFEAPNLLSLSQVLRLAGGYIDRARGRLLRISWQDQSDKIQSLTIQYEPFKRAQKEPSESQIAVIDEVCIHVYKQRKKIAAGSDKSGHRPFVNLSHGG